jgi:hypothetical protein
MILIHEVAEQIKNDVGVVSVQWVNYCKIY